MTCENFSNEQDLGRTSSQLDENVIKVDCPQQDIVYICSECKGDIITSASNTHKALVCENCKAYCKVKFLEVKRTANESQQDDETSHKGTCPLTCLSQIDRTPNGDSTCAQQEIVYICSECKGDIITSALNTHNALVCDNCKAYCKVKFLEMRNDNLDTENKNIHSEIMNPNALLKGHKVISN